MYDGEVRQALAVLADRVDSGRARRIWEDALDAHWHGRPCWLHGDVSAGNLLLRNGRLAAVIDFGNMAVGDPACDLAMAWTCMGPEERGTFLGALAPDAATVRRGRGRVLWKALIVLAGLPGTDPRQRDGASRALAGLFEV